MAMGHCVLCGRTIYGRVLGNSGLCEPFIACYMYSRYSANMSGESMEIQVSFPYLRALLSFECTDTVTAGDRVEILEGTRRGMVGTVEVLQRGSYKGTLCKRLKTD